MAEVVTLLILAAAAFALFKAAKWAWWPRREMPRHRVRHQRLRTWLYLHPGPGHASIVELHRHYGRRACLKRARQGRIS